MTDHKMLPKLIYRNGRWEYHEPPPGYLWYCGDTVTEAYNNYLKFKV